MCLCISMLVTWASPTKMAELLILIFGRPYCRSSLWYTVLSVCLSVCRLSSVICDVLYCGKMVRPSEKVSEGVNRKPGSKSSFLGSSTSGFAATATETAVFALFLPLQPSNRYYMVEIAYCQIVWSELKPEVILAKIIDLERCK